MRGRGRGKGREGGLGRECEREGKGRKRERVGGRERGSRLLSAQQLISIMKSVSLGQFECRFALTEMWTLADYLIDITRLLWSFLH